MLEFECIQVFENTWVNDLPEWLSIPEFLSKLGAVTARARGLNLIILISTNNESSFIIYVLSRQKDGNLLQYHSNSLNLYIKLLLQGCIQDRSTVFFYSQFRSEIRPFPLAIIIEFLPMVMQLMCNTEQNGKQPNTD